MADDKWTFWLPAANSSMGGALLLMRVPAVPVSAGDLGMFEKASEELVSFSAVLCSVSGLHGGEGLRCQFDCSQ